MKNNLKMTYKAGVYAQKELDRLQKFERFINKLLDDMGVSPTRMLIVELECKVKKRKTLDIPCIILEGDVRGNIYLLTMTQLKMFILHVHGDLPINNIQFCIDGHSYQQKQVGVTIDSEESMYELVKTDVSGSSVNIFLNTKE